MTWKGYIIFILMLFQIEFAVFAEDSVTIIDSQVGSDSINDYVTQCFTLNSTYNSNQIKIGFKCYSTRADNLTFYMYLANASHQVTSGAFIDRTNDLDGCDANVINFLSFNNTYLKDTELCVAKGGNQLMSIYHSTSNTYDGTDFFMGYSDGVFNNLVPSAVFGTGRDFWFIINVTNTGCSQSLVNSSWSSWVDTSLCSITDLKGQNRTKTTYDENACGTFSNVSFYEYQNVSCSYCKDHDDLSLCEGYNITGGTGKMLPAFILFIGIWAIAYYMYQTGNSGVGMGLLLLTIPLDIWLSVNLQEANFLGSGFLGIGFMLMAAFTLPIAILIRGRATPKSI